nr:MAG TPA: cytokine receptor common subunit [Caudoviricetes sp.]
MENAYVVIIIFSLIFFCWFIYKCCMSGYTTKRKNPDNYMEINKRQRDKGIAKIKAQDEYDNKWGVL